MQSVIRILAYPVLLGGSAVALVALTSMGTAYWPVFPLIIGVALAAVALLERAAPYEPIWNRDHGDLATDLFHNLANHGLIQLTVFSTYLLRDVWVPDPTMWPTHWPMWAQVLTAGVVLDLSLYCMHRWSHDNPLLWRLHAVHHSPERLYWLNSERRHPLSTANSWHGPSATAANAALTRSASVTYAGRQPPLYASSIHRRRPARRCCWWCDARYGNGSSISRA